MKRKILSGAKPQGQSFVVDYRYNYPEDIIQIQQPQLYRSDIGGNIYWFGYRFTASASRKQRTEFISFVNGSGENHMSESEQMQFINFPLAELNNSIGLVNFDCFVYPRSHRSPLVSRMISAVNRYLDTDTDKVSFEFVKQAPTDIRFDWDMFEAEQFSGDPSDNRYNRMCEYVSTEVLPKLQRLDYLSIAREIKPKYRKYLTGSLGSNSVEDIEKFSKLKGSRILITDDINPSDSAIYEMIRVLKRVNPECEIYVYTLIGNDVEY